MFLKLSVRRNQAVLFEVTLKLRQFIWSQPGGQEQRRGLFAADRIALVAITLAIMGIEDDVGVIGFRRQVWAVKKLHRPASLQAALEKIGFMTHKMFSRNKTGPG